MDDPFKIDLPKALPGGEWFAAVELARHMGVSVDTVHRRAKALGVRRVRIGGDIALSFHRSGAMKILLDHHRRRGAKLGPK